MQPQILGTQHKLLLTAKYNATLGVHRYKKLSSHRLKSWLEGILDPHCAVNSTAGVWRLTDVYLEGHCTEKCLGLLIQLSSLCR